MQQPEQQEISDMGKKRQTFLDLETPRVLGCLDEKDSDMVPTRDEVEQSRRLVQEIRKSTSLDNGEARQRKSDKTHSL